MKQRYWTRLMPAAVLTMALGMPAAAYAADAPLAQSTAVTANISAKKHDGHHRQPMASLTAAGAHEAMYLTLLAEKYAPDSANEWKAATAERARLRGEIRSIRESDNWRKLNEPEDDMRKEAKKEEVKPEEGKKSEPMKEEGKKGEGKKESGKQGGKEDNGKWQSRSESKKGKGESKSESKGKESPQGKGADSESHRQLHEQFTQAIESGDAARIKSALAELLPAYTQRNQQMAQHLDAMKRKLAASQPHAAH